MRILPLLLLVAGLSACQTAPKTPSPPPAPTANAQQLLDATHFRMPLHYLEAPLYDPEVKEWIPQRFLDNVQHAIQATIDYPFTDTQLQLALSKSLSGQDMQTVIDFYRSPSGQAALAAESSFRERLDLPGNTASADLTRQLLDATRLGDTLNKVFTASADALINRLDTYDCLAIMQIPGSHIGLNIAKRNRIDFMNHQIRRSLSNLYSGMSPEDLEAYLAFARSDIGKRYFAARVDAMSAIGTDFGDRVAEAIAPGLTSCVGSIRVSPN